MSEVSARLTVAEYSFFFFFFLREVAEYSLLRGRRLFWFGRDCTKFLSFGPIISTVDFFSYF
jgi:hypothetical protein